MNAHLLLLTFATVLAFATEVQANEIPQARLDESQRAFLREYCISCHDAEKQKGKVRLDDIAFTINSIPSADLWQKVLDAVNSGEMPPEDETLPETGAKTEFLDALSGTLVIARKVLADQGGKITMRRLNRREYRNSLRDLLGVHVDVRDLPEDGGTGSFDTVGASLFMSGDQIEQYLAIGRRALDQHFARAAAPSSKLQVRTEAEVFGNQRMDNLYQSSQEQHERYVKWTAAVDEAAKRAENVEVAARLREEAKKPRPSSGVPYATPLFFYLDWDQIAGAPHPKDFGFPDAQKAFFDKIQYDQHFDYYKAYQSLPGRDAGAWLLFYQAYRETYVEAPADWPVGEYTLRMRVAANPDVVAERRFVEIGQRGEDNSTFTVLSAHQVTGTLENPQIIEVSVSLTPGGKREFALRERRPNSHAAEIRSYYDEKEKTGRAPVPAIWVDWFELESPTVTLTKPSQTQRARTEAEELANRRMESNLKKLVTAHENYSRWSAAVEEVAKRPENAALAAELRKAHEMPERSQFDLRRKPLSFYNQWEKLAGAPSPVDFGIPDAEAGRVIELEHIYQFQYFTDYGKLPARDSGGWLGYYFAYRETRVDARADWPPGRYTLRLRVAVNPDAPKERRFIEVGHPAADPKDTSSFSVIGAHQVTGTLEKPQSIELSVDLGPTSRREFALRERRPNSRVAEMAIFQEHFDRTGTGPVPALWVDWFEIEGPQPAPSSPAILTVPGPDKNTARETIQRFATRAFRGRQPEKDYLDRLALIHDERIKGGATPEEAMKEALAVVLASPGFLYLHEPASSDAPRTLDPVELATRLSYFLWSAPPDDDLLGLAASGKLSDPSNLAAQTDRLLADPRSREFASGFTHQWLGLDRLDFFQFDFKLHRAFDDSAKADAREEVYETFATLLREDGSLTKLLKSDFVVVNGLLANYYGLEGVTGDHYRKVTLPPDSPRGGLLGMAAILAMGGNGEHTSPVERGAWVLRKLLHDPPPPAPPNVPQLARLDGKPLDVRARHLAHQEEAQCASCHRKIDPIGFGLENFDAAGKWRNEDHHRAGGKITATWPVDPSGAFHKGPAFADYFELRELVAAQDERFARGFTEALVEYALGRPFGFSDEELAGEILTKAQEKDHSLPSFIYALVASEAFHRK